LLKYITANLVFLNFLQPNLPGLFENNSFHAVNGALWTLKIEVMFYLFVPLVVMAFRKLGRFNVLITLYIASIIYSVVMSELAKGTGAIVYMEFQRQLPGQLSFLIMGAAGFYYFPFLVKNGKGLAVLSLIAFSLQAWVPWIVIEPIAVGILIVYFASVFPYIGNFGKYGDFSNGIYIVHFPILQMLISFRLFEESSWLILGTASLLMTAVAFLLWHFLKKPFLRKFSHYLAVSSS